MGKRVCTEIMLNHSIVVEMGHAIEKTKEDWVNSREVVRRFELAAVQPAHGNKPLNTISDRS